MSTNDRFQELTITDDFVFCTVFSQNEDLCRELAERILDRNISRIVYLNSQQNIKITPDGKGVRFDVYFEDDDEHVYDIEMQNYEQPDIPKRARYYQGMIDMDQTAKGTTYSELKDSYVIFISTFDPFHMGYSRYRARTTIVDPSGIPYDDTAWKIFLNPNGYKDKKMSPELKAFLHYLKNNIATDKFTRDLKSQVQITTQDRRWRREYMKLEDRDKMIRRQAHQEGVQEGRQQMLHEMNIRQCATIQKLTKTGMPLDQIAEIFDMTLDEFYIFCRRNNIHLN
ncbi:MAG: Rpn family recombination-promoting nuclease/putative transposase [Eubacterium sp.]